MENAWLWIYLFTRLDIIHFLVVLTLFLAVAITSGCVITSDSPEEAKENLVSVFGRPWVGVLLGLALLIGVAVPTKSDMALILGGHFGLQAATSEPATDTMSKLYRLVQQELDARLEEQEQTND